MKANIYLFYIFLYYPLSYCEKCRYWVMTSPLVSTGGSGQAKVCFCIFKSMKKSRIVVCIDGFNFWLSHKKYSNSPIFIFFFHFFLYYSLTYCEKCRYWIMTSPLVSTGGSEQAKACFRIFKA